MFERIATAYRNASIVVIGAGGIGTEIVRLTAPVAAKVVVADRQDSQLMALKSSLEAATTGVDALSDSKIRTASLDVTDSEAVDRFFDGLSEEGIAIDFLFYTAGILAIEPLVKTTAAAWKRSVEINLNGAFHCVHAAARSMLPRRSGSMLLLGSIAGTRARSGARVNPVYNSTKAALSAFVNGAAMQLRPHGVRINCISPGPTATPMMGIQPPEVHASVRDIALDGRMNEPREVAELALFVAGHGRFTGEDVGMGGGAGLGG
ncbi:MAG: hypothetical protein RIS70_2295 [Planctomycetota bacterium]|jgi:NAD(P)-dependent dehydrogenase (short-subunit alcohol dehydrogenase family)